MYKSATATRSVPTLLETRQRDDGVPRTLTLATAKLERLWENDLGRVSPALSSGKYSDFYSSHSAQPSPIDGLTEFAVIPELTEPTSLPPPPRRMPRRRPPIVSLSRETQLENHQPSGLASAPALSSPQEAEQDEPKVPPGIEESLKKLTAASNTKVAGGGETTADSSPLLTVTNHEIRSEPSFEELVVRRRTFSVDRPRIISTIAIPALLTIPSVPTPITERSEQSEPYSTRSGASSTQRLPVDDRDSRPPTPVADAAPTPRSLEVPVSERAPASPSLVVEVKSKSEGASPLFAAKEGEWPYQLPSSPPAIDPKYATLPLRVEKRGTRPGNLFSEERQAESAAKPKARLKGPSLIRKAGKSSSTKTTDATRGGSRHRGKLTKARDEMRQMQPYGILVSSSRDGSLPPPASDNPWRPGRKLLANHARSPSTTSWNSTTSYSAPSTIDLGPEHRISISSSIYPDNIDDAGSHIHVVPSTNAHHGDDDHDEGDDTFDDDDHPYDILSEIQSEQVIDPDNYQLMSILSGSRVVQPPQHPSKPPLPTTPKPIFSRKALSPHSSPSQSPIAPSLVFEGYQTPAPDLPPTSNWLGQDERADLIRKSRKLARVFGRTPGPEVMAYQDCTRTVQIFAGQQSPPRHHRTPFSFSNDLDTSAGSKRRRASAWPSPTETHFSISSESRRHSAPLSPSPEDISFLNASSPLYEASLSQVASQFRGEITMMQTIEQVQSTDPPIAAYDTENNSSSSPRTSFIDLYLSDEEQPDDGVSIFSLSAKPGVKHRPVPPSPSAQSLIENMSSEERAEEDRRRKREKLAKLHRYLGSRVPTNLVLGPTPEPALPPPLSPPLSSFKGSSSEAEDSAGKRAAWLRRRQSSSAALPASWQEEHDRRKEDLDTKEKALNVRRAQKMEKVFGVAPPQTLYHTRHSPSPSLPYLPAPKTLGNPAAFITTPEPTTFTKNPNRSSYQKGKGKRDNRPGTAESSKALLPKGRRSSSGFDHTRASLDAFQYGASPTSPSPFNGEGSAIYNHYQHSMNSLNDIMDRDDRASLLELHNYLNGEPESPNGWNGEEGELVDLRERKLSDASTKTERRRSLDPKGSNTSLASAASGDTVTSPRDSTAFQMRRRRAAKLTQFFGVHYRELINDVLDSLENGLEHEQKRGTLQAEEIEDLVKRLRELKVKREGLF